MPELVIDHRKISVPDGVKVIDAAERLGIEIPRFCFHPALGAVGACRVCAVKFEEGPVKGIQMSCMIDAKDGMVVSTLDPETVDFRKHVIEWLMLNHPHDCPVCDEGGHCLLQDLTVAGGHSIRRYRGPKRTYPDQDLGPLVQHEMNRCIHCYRCVRLYREYCGYTDLGVMGSANRVYYGRMKSGRLESPFSGNLIDICPTGVYTDKPSRYTGRYWDFERNPTVCIHCSLGCHMTAAARNREIVRLQARDSETVNSHFICDRGRYGFYYANLPDRPDTCRVDGSATDPENALQSAAERIAQAKQAHGPEAVAVVCGTRASLETLAAAAALCRDKGWRPPVFFADKALAESTKAAVWGLTQSKRASLKDVEQADAFIGIGADPVNEAPMLALAMRQAVRNGAKCVMLDPRGLDLPFDFEQISATPEDILKLLKACIAEDSGNDPGLSALKRTITEARRPAVICGARVVGAERILAAARLMEDACDTKGVFFPILSGANDAAASLMGGGDLESLLDDIAAGSIKALIVVEADPFDAFYDQEKLKAAFSGLETLVAIDCAPTPQAKDADVFLPTRTVFEAGGTFINQQGLAQTVSPVFPGGTPVRKTGHGDHPPRIFETEMPGSDVPAAWKWLFNLAGRPEPSRSDALALAGEIHSAFSTLAGAGSNGHSILNLDKLEKPVVSEPLDNKSDFLLITTETAFGTEPLSSHSPCLAEHAKGLGVQMNPDDAAAIGIQDGERVRIELPDGRELDVPVRIHPRTAKGVLVLPQSRALNWNRLTGRTVGIDKGRISKTGGGR